MCDKYGEKWAVRHIRESLLAKPSDLEKLVMAALDSMHLRYEREYWLATKASGRKQRVYLVDFMVHVYGIGNVAIEVNGNYAHERHEKRDKRKMRLMKRRGIPCIVLTDEDIKAPRAAERDSKARQLVALLRWKLGLQHDSQPEPPPGVGYARI
jgi:very-short-patch-repair endonuclease